MVKGEGNKSECILDAIEKSYADDINDEFIVPTVIEKDGEPVATIKENDSVIFFNFRPDRARQITKAIAVKDFDGFIVPTVIEKDGEPVATIKENDSVIFFNFRPDRARQITKAIAVKDFDGFSREFFNTYFVQLQTR